MIRKHHRKQDEETTYWLSYSDMMAGLLLTFVLIISLTMLRAKAQYDAKETELLGKEQELLVQTDALEDERQIVAAQQRVLDEQSESLARQQMQLLEQAARLMSQEETLSEQSELLGELQELIDEQKDKLDRIIGVRKELVEDLREEFEDSNLKISVDEQSGAIIFDASILFEYNRSELKDSGKSFLDRFLPRYVHILLGPEYRQYVSEIIIEGHTDTTGAYLFNLELSQKRAFAVAQYCLSDNNKILSDTELEQLREVVTTNGKSYSQPIYNDDGTVNMEASRRVEIEFRLKDEEMIQEMINILNAGRED